MKKMELIRFETKQGMKFCVPKELENFKGNSKYKNLGKVKLVKFASERDKKCYTELYETLLEKKEVYLKIDLYENNSFINIDKKETTEKEKIALDREVKKLEMSGKLPKSSNLILNRFLNNKGMI